MSDESIKKELELLAENIMEVLESTSAIKGEEFACAVGVHLECCQLVEAIGGLVLMARKVDEERADYLLEVCQCWRNHLDVDIDDRPAEHQITHRPAHDAPLPA